MSDKPKSAAGISSPRLTGSACPIDAMLDAMLTRTAAAIAHRVCIYQEHDPANGKVHGCCVVCGDPWPCETAKQFLPNNMICVHDSKPQPEGAA